MLEWCRIPGSSQVHASAPVEEISPQALHSAWASEACPTTISLHHCAVHQVCCLCSVAFLSVSVHQAMLRIAIAPGLLHDGYELCCVQSRC